MQAWILDRYVQHSSSSFSRKTNRHDIVDQLALVNELTKLNRVLACKSLNGSALAFEHAKESVGLLDLRAGPTHYVVPVSKQVRKGNYCIETYAGIGLYHSSHN